MENLLVNNQMSNEEFKLFCINHQMQNKPSQKEIDFLDFTMFIIDTAIHNSEDMGFLKADEYHAGNFDNCKYSFNGEEDVWSGLEQLTERDYNSMEEDFLSCHWEDDYNTCIISFKNDPKKYGILRM